MEELSLNNLFKILESRWKLILLFLIGCTAMVTAVTFFVITPQYSSSTQILVNRSREGETIQGSDIDTNVLLISTYKDIIKSPMILDDVREELGLNLTNESLAEKITMSNQANSQVFTLGITDTSPEQAAVIANTISKTFQKKVGEMMKIENVTIISSAVAKPTPVSPNKELSIAIGLILGFGAGIGAAFVSYFIDNTVKEEKFITDKLQWTPLGQIEEVSSKEFASLYNEEEKNKTNNPAALRSRV